MVGIYLFIIDSLGQLDNADQILEKYLGYLSVVIIELNIMKLYHRNMLCCTEWYVISLVRLNHGSFQ